MGVGVHGPDSESARARSVAAVVAASAAATSSLEKTLDEATERYSMSLEVQREISQLRAEAGGMAALAVNAPRAGALALAPRRLCWRGREVSEEFQLYAERVAGGEALAPYRGQVLARPCADSPWGLPEPPPRPPAPRSVVVGALLAASAWVVGVLLVSPHAPPEAELGLLPNAAEYVTPDAPSQLGALSSNDVERLGGMASGEVLSNDEIARALTSSVTSEGRTRKLSGRRRGSPASRAPASIPSPAAAPTLGAADEREAAPEAPAPPAPKTADEFDWLLDGTDGTLAAPTGASAVTPPEVAREATAERAPGKRASAPVVSDVRAPVRSKLLLENPTF
jgi:hypothetical protein